VGQVSSEKLKKKPHWVGNVLGGLLSANPTSYADYWFINKSSFYFPDETSTALLTILSMEKWENKVVTERQVAGECYYTQANDTIARFGFWNVPKALPLDTARYFWNGYDSATIQPLPNSWTKRGVYKPTVVKGVLYGKNFVIKNTNAPHMFDITYNGKLIATIQTDDGVPVNGYLYNAGLPQNTYRTFIVLATFLLPGMGNKQGKHEPTRNFCFVCRA